jgi:hypothetical protein
MTLGSGANLIKLFYASNFRMFILSKAGVYLINVGYALGLTLRRLKKLARNKHYFVVTLWLIMVIYKLQL